MHSKSDCRSAWRVAADMFIVVTAAAAGGRGVGREKGKGGGESVQWGVVKGGVLLDIGESLKASIQRSRVKQMGDSGMRRGPFASAAAAKSADVNAVAIFPQALTKPGDSVFQCNHLWPSCPPS